VQTFFAVAHFYLGALAPSALRCSRLPLKKAGDPWLEAIANYLPTGKMAGLKGCKKIDFNVTVAAPLSPITPAGTRMTPFSVDCLPAQYKMSVLEKNPSFEDADIVEASLGYGPANTPNCRCWYRMLEIDAASPDE